MTAHYDEDGGFTAKIPCKGSVSKENVEYKDVAYSSEKMEEVWFGNKDMIKEHEGWHPSTIDVVDMSLRDDGSPEPDIVRTVKRLIREDKDKLNDLLAKEREIEDHVEALRNLTRSEKDRKVEDMKAIYVEWQRTALLAAIARNEQFISLLVRTQNGTAQNGLDFQKAKAYPIDSIVKFSRAGFAQCIFLGHREKTGSLKYYKKDNHVYCFGCHTSGDAIDVVRAIRGCTIKEAVEFLTQ